MRASKQISFLFSALSAIALLCPVQLTSETKVTETLPAQWTLQVDKVSAGEVDLEPAFQVAIYENLVREMGKTKQFKSVLREGDRNANGITSLLTLKTIVEKYAPGSETRRAVTTVSGATKLTVRSQLCTRDNKVVLERTINGDVRFMGSNLRVTHNLARNIAKTIKESPLPPPGSAAATASGNSQEQGK